MRDRTKTIEEIIYILQKKRIRLTVNKIVITSLFYPGGTLAGHEKQIKKAIKNTPKAPPLSGVKTVEITDKNRVSIHKKFNL